MSERAAFIQAILATPDDDAPRLVFADWLDEHDEEALAEYIRLSCRLARRPLDVTAVQALRKRHRVLEEQHASEWLAPFRPLCMSAELQRGFVECVVLTHKQFLENAATLQAMAPVWLWRLRAAALFHRNSDTPTIHDVAHHPAFANVRDVEIGYYESDELLTEIAASPYRFGLRGITIVNIQPSVRIFQPFFESVPNLNRVMAISANAKALTPLWRPRTMHRLSHLELLNSKVSNELLTDLAESLALEQLESLWLDRNPFDDRGIAALADAPWLRNLRELSLADCVLGNEGAIRLARSPILQNIRLLNLAGCGIDARGCQELADSPYLEHLELLCLDRNRVSLGVEQELLRRFGPDKVSFGW
jgi:uncharacterized protein (TIGR02996 family)